MTYRNYGGNLKNGFIAYLSGAGRTVHHPERHHFAFAFYPTETILIKAQEKSKFSTRYRRNEKPTAQKKISRSNVWKKKQKQQYAFSRSSAAKKRVLVGCMRQKTWRSDPCRLIDWLVTFSQSISPLCLLIKPWLIDSSDSFDTQSNDTSSFATFPSFFRFPSLQIIIHTSYWEFARCMTLNDHQENDFYGIVFLFAQQILLCDLLKQLIARDVFRNNCKLYNRPFFKLIFRKSADQNWRT